MFKILNPKRQKILNIFYFKAQYFTIQIKMLLIGCLFVKVKNFKHIIPFLMALLFLATPNTFLAQGAQWPWSFDGLNFQISKNLEDHFSPAIASNGHLYLVVWYKKTLNGFDIYGTRINEVGSILDGEGIPICTASGDQIFPVVASDGENFFVVWQDKRSGKRWDIYGAKVTTNGQVLDINGIPIAEGNLSYNQISPALSFDGKNFIIVWQGKRTQKIWNIYFKRVSKNGDILELKPVQLSPFLNDQASPAVEFDGKNYMIVWQDKRHGKFWDIYGTRVTPSGEVLDPKGIQITYSDEFGWDRWKPVISWNGKYYLIVWMFSPGENKWYLYGKRVGPNGEILDLVDLHIQKDSSNKAFPAIIWDGLEHLIVWEEEPEGDSKIFGASIIPDFKPLPISEMVLISTNEATEFTMPALSKTLNNILIVWQGKNPGGNWQIYGQRLSRQNEIQ